MVEILYKTDVGYAQAAMIGFENGLVMSCNKCVGADFGSSFFQQHATVVVKIGPYDVAIDREREPKLWLEALPIALCDGDVIAKDVLTTTDVHQDSPVGVLPTIDPFRKPKKPGKKKTYDPPATLVSAAKRAHANGSTDVVTETIAKGESLSLDIVCAIDEAITKNEQPDSWSWADTYAGVWTAKILRKLDKHFDGDVTVAKAGNGVMLALWPPQAIQEALSVEGGEAPEDIHITLGYFGKLADVPFEDLKKIEDITAAYCAKIAPFEVVFDGYGRFDATEHSDGLDVIYAVVRSDELLAFRDGLVNALGQAGIAPKNNFNGYTPHATITYVPAGTEEPDADDGTEDNELRFGVTSVGLSVGSAVKQYRLEGINDASDASGLYEIEGDIIKVDGEQQIAFGWFSVVTVEGRSVVDTQGDIIVPEMLEACAYNFVLDARTGGEMHEQTGDGVVRGIGRLVESVVFTEEKVQAMVASLRKQGILATIDLKCIAWWGGFKIDDPVTWAGVKSGRLKAWSIGGSGKRAAIAA